MFVRNTINKLLFDFTCPSETIAGQLQSEVTHYTFPVLDQAIDEILTNASTENEHLIINKIEVNLGVIQRSFLWDLDVLDHFKTLLRDKIQGIINNDQTNDNHEIISYSDAEFESAANFLLTGTLPWWFDSQRMIGFDALVKKLIRERPEALRTILAKNRNTKYYIERLASQCKQSTKEKLGSLVPLLQGAFTSKSIFTEGKYEIQLRQLPKSILHNLNSIFSRRNSTNNSPKSLRLQRLVEKPYATWYKQLEILNIYTQEEIHELIQVYRNNRIGRKGRKQALKILNKLSIFQLEFLLFVSGLKNPVETGEHGDISIENLFKDVDVLDSGDIFGGNSQDNERELEAFLTTPVITQSSSSLIGESLGKNIDETFPTILHDKYDNDISVDHPESESFVKEKTVYQSSTHVNLAEGNTGDKSSSDSSVTLDKGNGRSNDKSNPVINEQKEYQLVNKGDEENRGELINLGKPDQIDVSSPNATSESSVKEYKESFKGSGDTNSDPQSKLANTFRDTSKGEDVEISLIPLAKIEQDEQNRVHGTDQESAMVNTADGRSGTPTSGPSSNSTLTSIPGSDHPYDSGSLSNTIKGDALNNSAPIESGQNLGGVEKPMTRTSTDDPSTDNNEGKLISEVDENDRVKYLNLESTRKGDENAHKRAMSAFDTPDTIGGRKVVQEFVPGDTVNSELRDNHAKDENGTTENSKKKQTEYLAEPDPAEAPGKYVSTVPNLDPEEALPLKKPSSGTTNYAKIIEAFKDDLSGKKDPVPNDDVDDIEKQDNVEDGSAAISYKSVEDTESNEKVIADGEVTARSTPDIRVTHLEQRNAQIKFIINKLGKAGGFLNEEVQSLNDRDLSVLETQFRQFEQVLRKQKQMVDAILEHPYLLRYNLLKLISATYTLNFSGAAKNNGEPEQKKAKDKSLLSAFIKRISSTQPAFVNTINNLSARDSMVLKDVLRKKVFETANERKTVKRILRKLPEETIELLHQFTRLQEVDMNGLVAFATANSPSEKGQKITESEFPHYKSQSSKIYVNNAGLCLLASYLPTLFKNLQYLEGNAFKNKASLLRALYLIQYLGTGQTMSPEYLLTFNKVICGIPPEENGAANIRLTRKEKAEADELLQSVIENWDTIKNTSLNGFRSSFLQRRGILTENELSWTLQVEAKSFDMLLSTISWGFGIIKLPWMKKHIQVEW